MRRVVPALGVLLLAAAAFAADPRLWIASGLPGGTYRQVYASNLERGLDGYLVLHRATAGSGRNLELLADGKVALAFAQADVFAERSGSDPERYGALVALGRLAEECLYVATRREGPLRQAEGLERPVDGRPVEIAVGPPGGGTRGSWGYLVKLRPGLAAARIHSVGDLLALRRLEQSTFDAVLWVTDPSNLDHPMLRQTRDNEALELLDLGEGELGGLLPDGTRVYEVRSVPIESGDAARRLRTLCTSALVLAHRDAPPELTKRVREILGLETRGR